MYICLNQKKNMETPILDLLEKYYNAFVSVEKALEDGYFFSLPICFKEKLIEEIKQNYGIVSNDENPKIEYRGIEVKFR
jgi:hypothetical protein